MLEQTCNVDFWQDTVKQIIIENNSNLNRYLPRGQHISRALRSALESSVRKTSGPACGPRPKNAYGGRIDFNKFIAFSNVTSNSSEVINNPSGSAPTTQLV